MTKQYRSRIMAAIHETAEGLRDASEDDAATLAFLDRRLQGVARAGQVRRKLSVCMGQM